MLQLYQTKDLHTSYNDLIQVTYKYKTLNDHA